MTTVQLETSAGLEAITIHRTHIKESPAAKGKVWAACGIFLFVLGIYTLSSPGRIDIIDGQARFDVAYNWLVYGRPIIRDNWIGPNMGVPGRDGLRYSYYGAPASVLGMPLVWLGLVTSAPDVQPSQFLFSLTSTILGATLAVVLFLFYLELGITIRRALIWTMVSSFATYMWPISTSTFDNAQHAFFALAALYFGCVSARRRSLGYAIIGGLMAGILVLYQEYFLLIVPALALSTLQLAEAKATRLTSQSVSHTSPVFRAGNVGKTRMQQAGALLRARFGESSDVRGSLQRYSCFLVGVTVGIALSMAYNEARFGSWLDDGKIRSITAHSYPLFENPIAGFLTLLISPGKSIFLYSPTLILSLMGIRTLWRQHQKIALALAFSTLPLILFLSCISFVGGDWCWGPRYLAVVLPLWALAFPFIQWNRLRRQLSIAVIGLGLLIQIMALGVETQRFFFENKFHDYFWAEDPWVYFKHSALFHRFGEIVSLADGVPGTAQVFNTIPVPEWYTYTLLGPPLTIDRSLAPIWMRYYKIFYLPRPWPLWMCYVSSASRPIKLQAWLWGLLALTTLGGRLIYSGSRISRSTT